jgi:hypothetical protein
VDIACSASCFDACHITSWRAMTESTACRSESCLRLS